MKVTVRTIETFDGGGSECPPYDPAAFKSSDPTKAGSCAACFAQGLDKPCLRNLNLDPDTPYAGPDTPSETEQKENTE